jgi:hypothetical protein
MNNEFNLGIIERFELFVFLFNYSNYNDDFLISGFHLNFLLVIKSRMKMMEDYGKNQFLVFKINFLLFRLECFYALTDGGKRIDLVDDRLRGINY